MSKPRDDYPYTLQFAVEVEVFGGSAYLYREKVDGPDEVPVDVARWLDDCYHLDVRDHDVAVIDEEDEDEESEKSAFDPERELHEDQSTLEGLEG